MSVEQTATPIASLWLKAQNTPWMSHAKIYLNLSDRSTREGADIVIECAGAAASIDQCLDAVRPLGTFTQVALIEHPVEVNWAKSSTNSFP